MTQRPTLTIATATNYPAGGETWSATPTVVAPDANWTLYGQVPKEGVPAQVLNAYLSDLRGGFDDGYLRQLGNWRVCAKFAADLYSVGTLSQVDVIAPGDPLIGEAYLVGDAIFRTPDFPVKSGIDVASSANPSRLATDGAGWVAAIIADSTPPYITIMYLGVGPGTASLAGTTVPFQDIAWRAASSRWIVLRENATTATSSDLWTTSAATGAVTFSQLYTAATNVNTRGAVPGARLEALSDGRLVALAGSRSGTLEAVFLRYSAAGAGSVTVVTGLDSGQYTPHFLRKSVDDILYAGFGTASVISDLLVSIDGDGETWTKIPVPTCTLFNVTGGSVATYPHDMIATGRPGEYLGAFTSASCPTTIARWVEGASTWQPLYALEENGVNIALRAWGERGFLAYVSATKGYFCAV